MLSSSFARVRAMALRAAFGGVVRTPTRSVAGCGTGRDKDDGSDLALTQLGQGAATEVVTRETVLMLSVSAKDSGETVERRSVVTTPALR